jgi:sulfate adenylyltransferase subunit 1 (EFTu-like GTPase family)
MSLKEAKKRYIDKTITWRVIATGSLILVDEATNNIVAAGMII